LENYICFNNSQGKTLGVITKWIRDNIQTILLGLVTTIISHHEGTKKPPRRNQTAIIIDFLCNKVFLIP
jgi:hypothetical protein